MNSLLQAKKRVKKEDPSNQILEHFNNIIKQWDGECSLSQFLRIKSFRVVHYSFQYLLANSYALYDYDTRKSFELRDRVVLQISDNIEKKKESMEVMSCIRDIVRGPVRKGKNHVVYTLRVSDRDSVVAYVKFGEAISSAHLQIMEVPKNTKKHYCRKITVGMIEEICNLYDYDDVDGILTWYELMVLVNQIEQTHAIENALNDGDVRIGTRMIYRDRVLGVKCSSGENYEHWKYITDRDEEIRQIKKIMDYDFSLHNYYYYVSKRKFDVSVHRKFVTAYQMMLLTIEAMRVKEYDMFSQLLESLGIGIATFDYGVYSKAVMYHYPTIKLNDYREISKGNKTCDDKTRLAKVESIIMSKIIKVDLTNDRELVFGTNNIFDYQDGSVWPDIKSKELLKFVGRKIRIAKLEMVVQVDACRKLAFVVREDGKDFYLMSKVLEKPTVFRILVSFSGLIKNVDFVIQMGKSYMVETQIRIISRKLDYIFEEEEDRREDFFFGRVDYVTYGDFEILSEIKEEVLEIEDRRVFFM